MKSKVELVISIIAMIGSQLYADKPIYSGQTVDHPQSGSKLFDPFALKDSCQLWVDGEALFWVADMDNLDYAITSSSTDRIQNGRIHEPHFNWDWGVRVGLGYKLPYDQWDILVNYTYVHANAQGDVSKKNGAVFPEWEAPFTVALAPDETLYAKKAEACWDANVNIADFELGRSCFFGKWLSIRPFLGVRGLLINQEYHVQYKGGTAVPTGDTDRVSMDNDFWGAGVRMGFDSLWGLGKGWGLYGDGAASLLSGHFDIFQKEKLKNADIKKVRISNHVDHVIINAEIALGVQWDYLFSKDRYHVGMKFGWEFNVFFDQNRLIRFVGDSFPGAITNNDDNLSFQGLTLGFRFDF